MKFTLSWLKEHLETEASVAEIAETLTDIGLEVEEVVNPLESLRPFTIGRVQKAEQHPDADRLRVCQVETKDGVQQIICGAPNARAGITVVIAHPGVYVPGIDTTIGVGKIRGVESHGMMASEREMGLSDEHEGIIELPSGEIGQSFADWLSENDPDRVDPMIEIAITPNRQDALGVHGIARDLAARGLGRLIEKPVTPVPGAFPCPVGVRIEDDTLDHCPHFAGRVIRGVKNGPSPAWLQARLKAIGLRPISALVDVTNFFTYDMNRPLHVFDVDKMSGNLRVHRAKGGETLLALDGKDYIFGPEQLIIADDNGPEAIGGVMGGEETGCTDETTTVFIESAYWDPVRTAYTGRDLRINSDARYRFERGVDPAYSVPGLEAATAMILELCGGEPSEVVEAGAALDTTRSYTLDTRRVESLVGMEIPKVEQVGYLTALGFGVGGEGPVDIPFLAQHFAEEFGAETARDVTLSDDFIEALSEHDFPGNVRELRNAVERAIAMASPGDAVAPEHLPRDLGSRTAWAKSGTLRERVAQLEAHVLRETLDQYHGNRTHTAEALGLSRTGLREKLKRLGID